MEYMFNKILATAVAILFLALLAAGYGLRAQYIKTGELESKIVAQEQVAKALQSSIEQTALSIAVAQKEQLKFEETATSVRKDINKAKRDLEALKGREAVVLKKLSLVELRINKSFKKSQNELSCITGDVSLCQN